MAKALDLPSAFPFAFFSERRGPRFGWTMRSSNADRHASDKLRRESFYIDKRGKLRTFDHKRLSRKRGGALRGKGWKYGSGFVDGVFPVLSPIAQQLLSFLHEVTDAGRVQACLVSLPPTHDTWDDLINVAVQLRLNKQWDHVILIGEWILHKSSFRSDVMCYNLLIDAYGEKSLYLKAEKAYLELMETRGIPTEDTYALLLKAYCTCNLLEKAEAVFLEMRKHVLHPSALR